MSDEYTAAFKLEGLALDDGWSVLSRLDLPDDHTGSAYSVGYLATHAPSGAMGFVKAFDYSEALADSDPARALAQLTAAYNAERDLLEECGQRRLNRVVRALAAGTVRVIGASPDVVSYLIFELANRDSRDMRAALDPAEHLPAIRVAHHAAVAMSQLHGIGVTHQDVKPSNLLVWDEDGDPSGKLGDLGCAHSTSRPAPHDDRLIPGDCSYAAPELLYGEAVDLPRNSRRVAADMYMLGNLFTFLLSTVSHSGLMYAVIDRSQHWTTWSDSFDEVLPALIDAHGMVLGKLRSALHSDIAEQAVNLINDLCYPDPTVRGDALARGRRQNPYALQRFVTRMDLLYRRSSLTAGARA